MGLWKRRAICCSLLFGVLTAQQQQQCRVSPLSSMGRKVYKLGILAIRGVETAFADFNSTAAYLTASIGNDFDPPISFEIAPVAFGERSVIDKFVQDPPSYDFIFANPSISSCVDSEIGTNSLVSMVSERKVSSNVYKLTKFGGVIFTRSDNKSVQSVHDIRGKSTACVSITGLGSGQMQFRELQRVGIHHLQDPKQVIFMENQGNVVQAVLQGKVDVGYVRTDQLERSKDKETGKPIDLSLLKIVDPKPGLVLDGIPFPFQSSTSLYPEWNIAALRHVSDDVARKVQQSLLSMSQHAAIAPLLAECYTSSSCTNDTCFDQCFAQLDPDVFQNCETTPDIATMAHEAMKNGRNAGWRSTLSYLELRNMQEETGFIKRNELTNSVKCTRSSNVADAVVCPPGYFKHSDRDIEGGCEAAGLPCYGFNCICSPCVRSFDVDFFPTSGVNPSVDQKGCAKFSRCALVEQTDVLTFYAVDNKKRNSTFEANVHVGPESESYPMRQIESGERVAYELMLDTSVYPTGLYIIEVFVGADPIPESPFRFEIIQRDCVAATGDERREPDYYGNCVCDSRSVEIRGDCILLSKVLVSILTPIAVIAIVLAHLYAKHKKREADSIWRIDPVELVFQEPPVVLGRGSFGLVLLADYRGTKVAVKRALFNQKGKSSSNVDSASQFEVTKRDGLAHGTFTMADALEGPKSHCFDVSKGSAPLLQSSTKNITSYENEASSSHLAALFSFSFHSGLWNNRAESGIIDEIRKISKLRHPCVTTVLGAVISPVTGPMLILEHMPLGSLYDLLHNDSMVLEGETILPIMRDVIKGLRFLHESSPHVVHGDMKSKNVLIDAQFRAKICDFGLAAIGRTRGNHAVGTPILRRETKNTLESDIYSFGILLYEIYSRKTPYEDNNEKNEIEVLKKVADKHVNLRPPIPQSCPPDIGSLMNGCLHSSPNRRPSAQECDETIKMTTSTSDLKADSLLSQIFPANVAEALRDGRKVEPKAHECVTVFFSDIVGYTEIASELTPTKVSNLLDRLYTKFDRLCALHDVFKVETVGDAYMTCSGLTSAQPEHVKIMAHFSIDLLHAASTTLIDESDPSRGHVEVRAGFHSGPVASHVVGLSNPRYSIIGDTVNIASRMESHSKAGRIQCSAASAKMLDRLCPDLEVAPRGKIFVKGKGEMVTYWIRPSNSLESASDSQFSHDSKILDDFGIEEAKPKATNTSERLIEWNTEVLSKYLRRIIAFRQAASQVEDMKAGRSSPEKHLRTGTPITEVSEVITLPDYNAKLIRSMNTEADNVDLPEDVVHQLRSFVTTISGMYRDNPFHNFEHASHVLLSIDKLLTTVVSPSELAKVDDRRREYTVHQYTYGLSSDPWTHFAVVFSALVHDCDHPGVSNAQLVKEEEATALMYQNKSVAEQNSIDLAWGLLVDPRYKALRRAVASTTSEMSRFRQLVVNSVLATDIVDKELKGLRNRRWEVAFSEAMEESPRDNMNRKATIVIEHLIQASDVAHTMQHWHVYRKWNELFFQECYAAYAAGRADSDPSVGWYEGELGFFDFYIIPLTRKLKDCGVFGASSSEYLNLATRNRAEWEVRGREVVSEMIEKVKAKQKKMESAPSQEPPSAIENQGQSQVKKQSFRFSTLNSQNNRGNKRPKPVVGGDVSSTKKDAARFFI